MRRRGSASVAANPVLIGAATTLVVIVAVFLAYNANNGLPFVPTYQLDVRVPNAANLVKGNEVRVGGTRVGLVNAIDPVRLSNGRYMAKHQPATVAGMEGLFRTQRGAGIVLIGQPDEEKQRIDNPLIVNNVLSFLIYGTTEAEVKGLDQIPRDQWPEPLPLLFYSYHIMAGLGTYFVLLMVVAAFLLWRGKLFHTRWVLWPLMLSFPLPYIANTAGWMTAEIGRQPWVVYGLIRTSEGYSKYVSAGNGLFTLLGFMGMYSVLSILFIVLVYRVIEKGPEVSGPGTTPRGASLTTA